MLARDKAIPLIVKVAQIRSKEYLVLGLRRERNFVLKGAKHLHPCASFHRQISLSN